MKTLTVKFTFERETVFYLYYDKVGDTSNKDMRLAKSLLGYEARSKSGPYPKNLTVTIKAGR